VIQIQFFLKLIRLLFLGPPPPCLGAPVFKNKPSLSHPTTYLVCPLTEEEDCGTRSLTVCIIYLSNDERLDNKTIFNLFILFISQSAPVLLGPLELTSSKVSSNGPNLVGDSTPHLRTEINSVSETLRSLFFCNNVPWRKLKKLVIPNAISPEPFRIYMKLFLVCSFDLEMESSFGQPCLGWEL
jgi:hypothetical protein